jgi:hypothetical protein
MRGALTYRSFAAGLAGSLGLTLCLGPSPARTDIFIFKDAGCNLALGLGFNAFSIPRLDLTPRLFGSYTPGFPLVFGIFSFLFGCTAEANTLFNYGVGVARVVRDGGIRHLRG